MAACRTRTSKPWRIAWGPSERARCCSLSASAVRPAAFHHATHGAGGDFYNMHATGQRSLLDVGQWRRSWTGVRIRSGLGRQSPYPPSGTRRISNAGESPYNARGHSTIPRLPPPTAWTVSTILRHRHHRCVNLRPLYSGHAHGDVHAPAVEVSVASSSTAHEITVAISPWVKARMDLVASCIRIDTATSTEARVREPTRLRTARAPAWAVWTTCTTPTSTQTRTRPQITPEQRHSYMMSDYPSNGYGNPQQAEYSTTNRQHGGCCSPSWQQRRATALPWLC